MGELRNVTKGTVVAREVREARTFPARLRGLLGRRSLGEGEALWIEPCAGVHTVGMRFPIDVAFCDARGVVVRIVDGLRPFRLTRFVAGARSAVELPAATCQRENVELGDRLELRSPRR